MCCWVGGARAGTLKQDAQKEAAKKKKISEKESQNAANGQYNLVREQFSTRHGVVRGGGR